MSAKVMLFFFIHEANNVTLTSPTVNNRDLIQQDGWKTKDDRMV